MQPANERTYLARDVYQVWKKRIRAAEVSTRVFTPYLDHLLVRLLGNSQLSELELSVVTDLSPTSGALDYRNQLLGIRALLKRGIEVRSLARLHAKVLVCDEGFVTVGSQNFTSYARKSRETTVAPDEDLSSSAFNETLREWFESATPIELEFVEELLLQLDARIQEVRRTQRDLVDDFEALVHKRETQREALRRQRQAAAKLPRLSETLGSAFRQSRKRLAGTDIWAHLQRVGEFDPYDSLLADKDSDLTRWVGRGPDDSRTVTELNRLQFYPIILNPSGRMGFARVGRSRITYVRESVNWVSPRLFDGQEYRMSATFPTKDLEESNIHILLNPVGRRSSGLLMRVRFDGISAVVVSVGAPGQSASQYENGGTIDGDFTAVAQELTDATVISEVLRQVFEPFRYGELDVQRRNADDFFPTAWVRVTLIEHALQPVLMVSEQ